MRLAYLVFFSAGLTGCAASASGSLDFRALVSLPSAIADLDVAVSVTGGEQSGQLVAAAAGLGGLVMDIAESRSAAPAPTRSEADTVTEANTTVAASGNVSDRMSEDRSPGSSSVATSEATTGASSTTVESRPDRSRSPSGVTPTRPSEAVVSVAGEREIEGARRPGSVAVFLGSGPHILCMT